MFRFFTRISVLHQFALLAGAFAILSALGGLAVWTKIMALQDTNSAIIEKQYPARLAMAEAKASAAGFASLAYRGQTADAEQKLLLKQSFSDEIQRFTHWLENVNHDDPQTVEDLKGINERFERLQVFLKHFLDPKAAPDSEARDFQLEYRFSPLRDDLDASLNHLSNRLGAETQNDIELIEHVQTVELVRTAEVIAISRVMLFVMTSVWLLLMIAQPLRALAQATEAIVNGDLGRQISVPDTAKEVRIMSHALKVFRDAILFTRKLEDENRAAKDEQEAGLAAERRRVAEIFRNDVMQAVMIVSGATSELQQSALFMRDRSIETDQRAQAVIRMSSETAMAVGSLSESSTELSETVGTMNDHLMSATQIAVQAVDDGRSTSKSAEQLVGAVEEVNKITGFISDIAYKINLLALNATIEAARCGDMGRGFAVVAQEVKTLANATSRAAADIARQLAAVKGATDHVVEAINITVDGIGKIGTMTDRLEYAYGQKERASRSIAGCVDLVAENTTQISNVIVNVGRSTEDTQRIAEAMLEATRSLSEQTERLLVQSRDFCDKIALEEAA